MSRKITDNEWEDAMRGMPEPPEVPRQRMWQAIDSARQEKRGIVAMPAQPHNNRDSGARIWRMVAAMAAILVLGVAIGRMTATPEGPGVLPGSGPAQVADSGSSNPSNINRTAEKQVYRLAAANLFGRADFLLTDFNVRPCNQQDLGETPSWAGSMLLQTRLLLDTPVADDMEMHKLLEELELVLAQIVSLSRENCVSDTAWIKQGLQERSTLDRLRIMSDSRVRGAL